MVESAVTDIVGELSFHDKVALLSGATAWRTHAVPDVGITSVVMADGPHGVRVVESLDISGAAPATCFPVEAMAAATWDPELAYRMGRAIAAEARAYGVDLVLGPGVNGKRSPLGGRNFEYFSEDPFLSAAMAIAVIRGIQSHGVGATIKHFAANEQETNRFRIDVRVDERALHEIYLYPFERALSEAGPWMVMSAYNGVNGEACSENRRLLSDILRDEWGYDGVVCSDWGAMRDKPAAVRNGLDLEMPGPSPQQDTFEAAIERGEVTAEDVDERVAHVVALALKAERERRQVPFDPDAHHALAREIAAGGITLLKNDQDVLPLRSGSEIAVVGASSERPRFQAGGSSELNPRHLEAPIDELRARSRVAFAPGYDGSATSAAMLDEARAVARGKDHVVVFVGTTEDIETEGRDRTDIDLPEGHVALVRAVAEVNDDLVVILNAGSVLDVGPIEDVARGIVHAWLFGEAGASALAQALFGEKDPGGRVAETFPLALEHNPSYENFPGDGLKVEYREGILVGYRYYDTKKLPVRYPFGYGLSYTSFSYDGLRLSASELRNGDSLTVSCDVTNTGSRPGSEVVQVYVRDVESLVLRPDRELKGFSKVRLAPGQTERVTIELDERAFAFYSTHMGRFAVESGTFEILVGSSSRDIYLTDTVEFDSVDEVRPPLTLDHSLQEWLGDDRYCDRARKIFEVLASSSDAGALKILVGAPVGSVLTFLDVMAPDRSEEIDRLRSELSGA